MASMGISVGKGIDNIQDGIEAVADAPGQLLSGDVKEAINGVAGAGNKVKRGAIETVLSVAKAPIDGVSSLLGSGSSSPAVREGAQLAVEKHLT